ncbi:MAG TPA: hypothetical protein VFC00_20030 [Micromonosporaceae bacterium]|nr:hypothetical protein [Micromonosporaceae bacterium]
MGAFILVVFGIAAVVAYVYACMFLLAYVTTPLVLLGGSASVLAGILVALSAAHVVLAGRSPRTEIRTPTDVVAGRLPGRVGERHIRRDQAWPQYFAVQVKLDLVAISRHVYAVTRESWARPLSWLQRFDLRLVLALWPLVLPVLVAVVGFSTGALFGIVLVAAVFGAVTAAAWAVGLVGVAVLRGVDRGWQVMVRAGGSCPRCYEVSSLPAYQCPGEHPVVDRQAGADLHRDLRPGRLGVLWRRCACGTRLPTTVLRAANRLQATCPMCREPLHRGAAAQTDVRIPVFGAASAGKTHLILASLVTLKEEAGTAVQFADEHSERVFLGYEEVFRQGRPAPKTDTSHLPVALTLRVRVGRRRAMVHVYDAAGEALADPDLNAQLAYLDRARTLAFVLDPFSIPDIRDLFEPTFGELFGRANAAKDSPEQSYQATVMRLRAYGVDTERQRLAFVVSKRDLLCLMPALVPAGSDSSAVRAWLLEHRLDNLVTAAERDFGDIRYFLVAAHGSADMPAVTAPFRWLLASERVSLPVRPGGASTTTDGPVRGGTRAPAGRKG